MGIDVNGPSAGTRSEDRRAKAQAVAHAVVRPDVDVDVVIVGAGPTGLMLAAELCLHGVRPVVVERRPQLTQAPKANGLGGRILDLLAHRGLLDQLEAVGNPARRRALVFPFGGERLDFTGVTDPPLRGMSLAQAQLERILEERARELGAEIRRGHEAIGLDTADAAVRVRVRGPKGVYPLTARFLVGCDGPRSQVRELAGVPFPGATYREVNRLAQVFLDESVTELENGDLDVPGLGPLRLGFTRTAHGMFAAGRRGAGELMIQVTEEEAADVDDADSPLTLAELQESISRVLGAPLPVTTVTRLSRYGFQARMVERYRHGRILLAGEAAHVFPATGVGLNVGMTDAVNLAWKLAAEIRGWAPPTLLDTYDSERRAAAARTMMQTQAQAALRRGHDPATQALRELFRELMVDEQPLRRLGALIAATDTCYPMPGMHHHPLAGTFVPDLVLHTERGITDVAHLMHRARPVLLDLADRRELRKTAEAWRDRVDVHIAGSENRPADALLIRPDGHIAWAAAIDESTEAAKPSLQATLSAWWGAPNAGKVRASTACQVSCEHS